MTEQVQDVVTEAAAKVGSDKKMFVVGMVFGVIASTAAGIVGFKVKSKKDKANDEVEADTAEVR